MTESRQDESEDREVSSAGSGPRSAVRRHRRGAAAPGPRGPGPAVLLLPIVALLGLALWRQAGGKVPTPQGDTEAPELASGRADVDGWQGSERIRPGLWLDARLVPLHADAARQAFDARALGARFALGAGEPWRLTLTARVVDGSDVAFEDVAEQSPVLDALESVSVDGLSHLVGASRVMPSDPVATLFAAPSVGLAPGQACDLFLWGERPMGDVVVRASADVELSLAPRRLSEPLTTASLARVDGGVR